MKRKKIKFMTLLLLTVMLMMGGTMIAQAKTRIYYAWNVPSASAYMENPTYNAKIKVKGNTLKLTGCMLKYWKGQSWDKAKYLTYGTRKFKLTKNTKYYLVGENLHRYSRKSFMKVLKSRNGLGMFIYVKNKKVVQIRLCS